jgi:molybdate transport system substrate-binding protein
VGVFPANSHPPIAYPVALTSRASPAVVALLRFLKGPAARQVFVNNGFIALTRD